jgi:hypothetical protein
MAGGGRRKWTAAVALLQTADAKARRTSALTVRCLRQRKARVGDRPHWQSIASGGGRSRLGGGRPIEEVIRLIFLYFHLPLTTSDVLQLFLALVAPIWWRVGVLFVITYT